jgi:glycosyltransferase involved in cell wall biosynthesis
VSAAFPIELEDPAARLRARPRTTAMIIAPIDVTAAQPGGIQSFIGGFVKVAPDELGIASVGISSELARPLVGHWRTTEVGHRNVRVISVLSTRESQPRDRIPLSLQFAAGVFRHRTALALPGGILQFHRPGTLLPLFRDRRPKVQIVHHDAAQIVGLVGENRWRFVPALYRSVERLTAAHADAIVVVSESAAADLAERFPGAAGRIAFIPNWVDDEVFALHPPAARINERRALSEAIGAPANAPMILYVGRLEATKDPVLAVRAFAHFARRHPDAHLVMAGIGSLFGAVGGRAARLGTDDRVHLLGPISREAVAGWMNVADALLVSSHSEAGPTSAIEALACGLPVVGTAVGRLPNLVVPRRTGWIAGDRTPAALAAGLDWALRAAGEETRQACAAVARRYAARTVLEPLYELHLRLGHDARAARSSGV